MASEAPPYYVEVARIAPLGVAIVAPIVTLLDIPALTQRWYSNAAGDPLPDPDPSIALSAVSLAFCALGNGLMVLKFSSTSPELERRTALAPLFAFGIKTIVEVVNLSLYGTADSASTHRFYTEGFWSAAFSCGLSGLCALMLLAHATLQRNKIWQQRISIRVEGRHFMLVVLAFVASIGVQALVFSQIEGWYYLDGIYFSIVSCLTVGFGDLTPTKPVTRALLFPFALVAIALLGNVVSSIVGYFGRKSELRRFKNRAQKAALAKQSRSLHDEAKEWGLLEEINFLESMHRTERRVAELYDLALSLLSFLAFWTLGAVVFKYSEEDWSYGMAFYFVYVFFLTIGYGDLAPTSPSSRVFFILFALLAVPVVASFAVQTVTAVMENVAEHAMERAKGRRAARLARRRSDPQEEAEEPQEEPEEGFKAHSHFVLDHLSRLRDEPTEDLSKGDRAARDHALARRALGLAVELESQARMLLIASLPTGSQVATLLRADRNVQRRDVMMMGAEGPEQLGELWESEDQAQMSLATEIDQLASVRRYRETFAELLVAGSQLLRLEDHDRRVYLRTQTRIDPPADCAATSTEEASKEQQAKKEMRAMELSQQTKQISPTDQAQDNAPPQRSDDGGLEDGDSMKHRGPFDSVALK